MAKEKVAEQEDTAERIEEEAKSSSGSTGVTVLAGVRNVSFDSEGAGKLVLDVSAADSMKLAHISQLVNMLLEVTIKVADK